MLTDNGSTDAAIESLAGRLLADVIEEWLTGSDGRKFGMFIEDIPQFEVAALLDPLAESEAAPRCLRVSLLGLPDRMRTHMDEWSRADCSTHGRTLDLNTLPHRANAWRDDDLGDGTIPHVVVLMSQAEMVPSLRTAYSQVGPDHLRRAAALYRRGLGFLPRERELFWDMLTRRNDIPVRDLLDFLDAVARVAEDGHAAGLQEREPKLVHKIGLIPHAKLFEASTPQALAQYLRRNAELRRRLCDLSDTDRNRLLDAAGGDIGDDSSAMASVALAYARTPGRDNLDDLEYEALRRLLIGGPTQTSLDSREEPRQTKTVLGDELVVEAFLEGSEEALPDALARTLAATGDHDGTPTDDETDTAGEPIVTIGDVQYRPAPRSDRQDALAMCQAVFSAEHWGAYLDARDHSILLQAVRSITAGKVHPVHFRPDDDDWPASLFRRAAEYQDARLSGPASQALGAWVAYAESRQRLLESLPQLVDCPLLGLEGDPRLGTLADEHLERYDALLSRMPALLESLRSVNAGQAARELSARLLALDSLVVRLQHDWQVIAGPLHPFHLWQWRTMAQALRSSDRPGDTDGSALLRELVRTPPPVAPNVVLTEHVVRGCGHVRTLLPAGRFASLLLFAEPSAALRGPDGASVLSGLAGQFVRLQPHSAQGLRLALVDPPSLAGVLKPLFAGERTHPLTESGRDAPVPCHIRVLRTRPDALASTEELDALDEVQSHIEEMGGSLVVEATSLPLPGIAQRLASCPAHIAAVFDPGAAEDFQCNVAEPPASHPLVLPRAYTYNEFQDTIQVVPASRSTMFQTYHALLSEIANRSQEEFVVRRSGAMLAEKDLVAIAKATGWLVLLDRGIDPMLTLKPCLRLAMAAEGGREIAVFTAQADSVNSAIAEALGQSGLPPHQGTIARFQRNLRLLGGESVLALLRPAGRETSVEPRRARGFVGLLRAAQWYSSQYPDALLVSLDDTATRRWIVGQDDAQRADLLAVRPPRQPDGPVAVEAIEVKTHEHGAPVRVSGPHISGPPVDQVDSTLTKLRRVLETREGVTFDAARRAVLEDHMYRTVASRDLQREQRREFVHLLQRVFCGEVEYCGLVADVRISVGAHSEPEIQEPRTSPKGFPVGLVVLVEPGEGEFTTVEPTPVPGTPVVEGSGVAAATTTSQTTHERTHTAAHVRDDSETLGPEPFRFHIGPDLQGAEVEWEPHRPEAYLRNFGIQVTGESGSGKTQFVRALIRAAVAAGVPVTVLDFKNDYAPEDFSASAGLRVYDISRSGLPFNPLAMVPNEDGLVSPRSTIVDVAGIMKRVLGLGPQQEGDLRKAIEGAFSMRGIGPRDRDLDASQLPPAPGFDQILGDLEDYPELWNRLDLLFDYLPAAEEAALTFEDLLCCPTVLDVHAVREDMRTLLAEFVVLRLHELALRGEQPRELRRLLVFDEAHRLSGSAQLENLVREGRAFGVGVVLSTQFVRDVTPEIAGNLATKLFFRAPAADARRIAEVVTGSATSSQGKRLVATAMNLSTHQAIVVNQHWSPYAVSMTVPDFRRTSPPQQG